MNSKESYVSGRGLSIAACLVIYYRIVAALWPRPFAASSAESAMFSILARFFGCKVSSLVRIGWLLFAYAIDPKAIGESLAYEDSDRVPRLATSAQGDQI
ncbi:hypothetical protein Q31b_33130 [Novipirellula aureliae]|uniref:Uncharacterized protein n=1 Tax=Novipirellula aureliae TaxID=2527966 RepID=A0A5C6DVL4_9BACT|nr:hypothetical protein Q31b_33130 [Novipirellula aureliae]